MRTARRKGLGKSCPFDYAEISGVLALFSGTLTNRKEHLAENLMTAPRNISEQRQGGPAGDTAEATPSGESLGEQLLREAREGQAEFVTGWREFLEELGVQGKPLGARQLREMLLQEGINPENNEFSRDIIAMREE